MTKLTILLMLIFFTGLAAYRFFVFTPPPMPDYPATRPFPGNAYETVDINRYDVTNIHDYLSFPKSLNLSSDGHRLVVTQNTGEILAFSRDPAGSFTVGPRLLPATPPLLTPATRPTVSQYVRLRPESIEKGYTSQIADSVTDPQTGAIYFIDYLGGRLYRILPTTSP